MADPYKILGVDKVASLDDIRKAYRKLAKETHPDLNPGNVEAERRFKEISAANAILADTEKRKRFDAGEIDESGVEQPERRYYREYAEADPHIRYGRRAGAEDFADRDDIFADLFRGRGPGIQMPGESIHYTLPIDFLDAINGVRKSVGMPDGKILDIKIPAGLRDGQILRLKGQGRPGLGGGPPGDALVEMQVLPHAEFRRDGKDIHSVLPITIGEALNGATVRADTVDGSVNVKIPKGANSKTALRLRGKGVPLDRIGAKGDHLIELRVVLPELPDAELANFIADWETKHPYNPRQKTGGTP